MQNIYSYEEEKKVKTELLMLEELPGLSGQDIFNVTKECLDQNGLSLDNCVSNTTDGGPNMVGSQQGFVSRGSLLLNYLSAHTYL